MKALLFEINKNGQYHEAFDTVPKEILNLLEDGYFDDNGDLADGNCILILITDLEKEIDLSEYEVVEVEVFDYNCENKDDFEGERWMGYSSRDTAFCVKD